MTKESFDNLSSKTYDLVTSELVGSLINTENSFREFYRTLNNKNQIVCKVEVFAVILLPFQKVLSSKLGQ